MKQKNKSYVRQIKLLILICALICSMLAPSAALRVDAAPKWKTAYKKIVDYQNK